MRPPLYKSQVTADLERWEAAGFLTAQQKTAILEDLQRDTGRPLSDWLGLLGAVLTAAAAVTFVAANWEDLPKLARLGTIGLALVAAHGLSALLFAQGKERLAQAAVLLAVGLFGAAIMLVGQTYHFNADFPGGIMLWGIGALGAAVLVPSRTALGAGLVLGALWTHVAASDSPQNAVHWAYLPYWMASAVLAVRLNWWSGAHLSVLALFFWIGRSSPGLEQTPGMPFDLGAYALLALVILAGAFAAGGRIGRIITVYAIAAFLGLSCADYLAWLAGYKDLDFTPLPFLLLGALTAALAALGAARGRLSMPEAGALGGLALIHGATALTPVPLLHVAVFWLGVVLALAFGVFRRWPVMINFSLLTFTAGLLVTYFRTFGSLIETALLFGVGGAVFVALSVALSAVSKRWLPPEQADPGMKDRGVEGGGS